MCKLLSNNVWSYRKLRIGKVLLSADLVMVAAYIFLSNLEIIYPSKSNICRNLQLRRGLVLRYSSGSGRGATVEFTAGLAVNLCMNTQ